ncbi:ferrous iron transport protein A [Clostridium oceanicum]|uniref:Ferrous iron transport protein A n=1 Tax=Clostridium oceanicum TaxID=1543 RepID=A0ABN1JFU5_9CLOT
MSICELNPGEKGVISNISGNKKLAKRLLALGCIEGTEIFLKNRAPLGDPVIINLRGFNLAIRKKDAKNIFVSKMEEVNDNCSLSW